MSRLSPRATTFLVILGAWSVFGVVATVQTHVFTFLEGEAPSLGLSVLRQLPNWTVWVVLTPGVLWLAGRFPIGGSGGALRALALHLAAALVVAWLHSAASFGMFLVLFPTDLAGEPFLRMATTIMANRAHYWLITYASIVGLDAAFRYYRRFRDGEIAAAELRAQLTETQLDALAARLRPHFLFNTLQAISALVDDDPAAARRMIADLGDLLRATLTTRESQLIPLTDELELLRRYLEIERTRFQDRLTVEYDLQAGAEDALVPQFVLQPLVENAVKHGITKHAGDAGIRISAKLDLGRRALELAVEDWSAHGVDSPPASWTEGVGLQTTRERLEKLFGDRQRLTVMATDGGVLVGISMPFATETEAS